MPRKLLLFPLLAVAIVMATAPVSQAQYDPNYDRASVYSVPGRVVQVNYDQGSYTADGQFVYYDQVIAQYYGPDRLRRQDWADAPSSGGIRPMAGDEVTCEIDAENYGLLAVNGWYRPNRPALYFVYDPTYYRHHHIILWPEYYRRHFGGYYHGPRFYGGRHYSGPRYRSRDWQDRQPRYDAPPRYRQPRDRGDRQQLYGPRNPMPRRSPGEYQYPGGRGQYEPPADRRTRPPDNQGGIRPRPGYLPGSPPDRSRDQRPSPGQQYQAPRQYEQRPHPAQPSRGSEDRSSRSPGNRPRQGR